MSKKFLVVLLVVVAGALISSFVDSLLGIEIHGMARITHDVLVMFRGVAIYIAVLHD